MDEILIAPLFAYRKDLGKVLGYIDLETLDRKNLITYHALVCMIQRLKRNWKQSVILFYQRLCENTDLKFVLL